VLVANPVPPPPDASNTRAYTGWLKKTFPPGTPVVLTEDYSTEGPAYAPIILPAGLKGEVQELLRPTGWHFPDNPPGVVVNWYEPAPGAGGLVPPTPTSIFLPRVLHAGSRNPVHYHDAEYLQPLIDTWGVLVAAPMGRHHLPSSQRSWMKPNRRRTSRRGRRRRSSRRRRTSRRR
jgi:hypothetical protein